MTGSSLDREEHIDRCACDGIYNAALTLAALKNLIIPENECASLAGAVAANLGADRRARYVEAPAFEINREVAWQINNGLDWMAAHHLVLTYMLVHSMQMSDLALGMATDNVVQALKGPNHIGGPTWRWPSPAQVERTLREQGDSAWPLDPVALGVCAVNLQGDAHAS